MSAFYFGPLGAMAPIEVSVGAKAETSRGFSEFVSSGGVRYVQAGRAAPRTWSVSRLWQEPSWERLLSIAAHGLVGDTWLYDTAAARDNMLPAGLCAGNGSKVPVSGIPMGTLSAGHEVKVPVLAGRLYTISGWSQNPGVVLRGSFDGGTVEAQQLNGLAEAAFTPAADAVLSVTVPQSGLSGLRVHDGPPDGRFLAGYGTPCKVAVQDPDRTLQMLNEKTFSDYEVTLYEVGKPGVI